MKFNASTAAHALAELFDAPKNAGAADPINKGVAHDFVSD